MVLAVVLLFLLALLGMAALSTSSIETQIAGNELRHELAYYAAESAIAYVVYRPDLYGHVCPEAPSGFPRRSGLEPPNLLMGGFNSNVFHPLPEDQGVLWAYSKPINIRWYVMDMPSTTRRKVLRWGSIGSDSNRKKESL